MKLFIYCLVLTISSFSLGYFSKEESPRAYDLLARMIYQDSCVQNIERFFGSKNLQMQPDEMLAHKDCADRAEVLGEIIGHFKNEIENSEDNFLVIDEALSKVKPNLEPSFASNPENI